MNWLKRIVFSRLGKDPLESSDVYRIRCVKQRSVSRRRRSWPTTPAHGGAVQMYHLLKEAAEEFDIFLFAFASTGR